LKSFILKHLLLTQKDKF